MRRPDYLRTARPHKVCIRVQRGRNIPGSSWSPSRALVKAVHAVNAAKVRDALARGADPNTRHLGHSCLTWAVRKHGSAGFAVVDVLLEKGADPNLLGGDGCSALSFCFVVHAEEPSAGDRHFLSDLLSPVGLNGVHPVLGGGRVFGATSALEPLLTNRAERAPHVERCGALVLRLLEAGASAAVPLGYANEFTARIWPDERVTQEQAAWALVSILKDREVQPKAAAVRLLQALVDQGLNPNAANGKGEPLLWYAVVTESVGLTLALLRKGASSETEVVWRGRDRSSVEDLARRVHPRSYEAFERFRSEQCAVHRPRF